MYGSDWPLVELAGGYARWRLPTVTDRHLSAAEREQLAGATARSAYRLRGVA